MDLLTKILILIIWVLIGVIILLYKRKILIYDKNTNEIFAIVTINLKGNQILKNNLDITITNNDYKLYYKNGKIYINVNNEEGE